jgi:multiple antibiotic resistance protein
VFAVAGQLVFRFFAVSVDSLRVVGGVILFLLGYEMLQAQISRTRHDEESAAEFAEDIAITPLGIPMIAGPGAITTAILLMNSADQWEKKAVFFAMLALSLALSLISLLAAKRLVALLGGNLNKVLMRGMGLIMMMIAVEFFFAGLRPIVRTMIQP